MDRIIATPNQLGFILRDIRKSQGLTQKEAAEVEGFRISLTGAQVKTAFLRYKGQWMIPEGPTPTTHIFKLPMGMN